MRLKQILLFFSSIILFQGINAQLSIPDIPYSLENQLALSNVPVEEMPAIDLEAIQAEDEIMDNEPDLPYRFGIEHEVSLDMENSGVWVDLPNGARLWRLAIYAPEALSINLVYEDFFLPQGSKFFLHNGDYEQVLGAFTARNNKSDRAFGTALVYGETSYLEYYEPAQVRGQGNIAISKVVHGYRSIFKSNNQLGDSGSCNVDTECSQGDDWRDQIRAVGKTIAGGFLCTGTLVGNATGDLRPYFLTANHCGFFSSMVVYWLFERPNCGSGTPDDTKTTTGGTLLASVDGNTGGSIRLSDHLLIELSENPSDAFNVYYAGWDANGAIPQAVTGIHHPAGDAKKISMENDPLTSTVYLQNTTNPNAGQWRVADWDSGTTEGGSSGSPIFDNTTKRIVGMLSGGFAACGNNSADWYGKFSFAWNNNGTTNPAFRLRDWLDPNNTGTLAIDGYDINESDFTLSSSSTNEKNCSGNTVVNSVSYTIMVQTNSGSTDPVTLSVSGQPSGASVSFSTNPVVPGNSTVLTVSGLTSVAVGNYILDVQGMNASGNDNLPLNLEVLDNCNIICDNITSTDVPVTIPGSTTVESDITVTDMGIVTDINVSFSGTHDRVRDLTFELRSPDGTTIQLVDLENPCDGRQDDFDFGFDDESSLSSIPCPPTTGLLYVPEEALSAFDGEEINGTWTLIVTDVRSARTGVLNNWQLDYCIQPMSMGCSPTLTVEGDPMNNDIIDPGIYQASNAITATGRVESSSTVTFEAGQSITLSSDFIAENGSTFTARIQACASATEENMIEPRTEQTEFLQEVAIFPNPFRGQTTIALNLIEEGEVRIQLFDVTGRQVATVLETSSQLAGAYQYQLDANNLETGIYILTVSVNGKVQTKKLSVMK